MKTKTGQLTTDGLCSGRLNLRVLVEIIGEEAGVQLWLYEKLTQIYALVLEGRCN